MAKVRDYHKLALDIIDVVGGQKNIVNATRCATRLRLVLKETPEGVKEKVSALAGVITVVENNGQFQVVIGTHVGEVYDSVAEALHLDASAQEIEQPKQNIVNRIICSICTIRIHSCSSRSVAGSLDPDHDGGTFICRDRNL